MQRKFLSKVLADVSIDKKAFESNSVFIIFPINLVNELDYFFSFELILIIVLKIGFI